MRHGALFNGIGGFQLAAHWMGWENVFHCEIDKFCNQVVKRNFPESICYEDIKKTDFTAWRGTIDILTGGFPCQPYSSAGKRLGKEDERHLWPEMLRAIREVRPGWVVGENVRGLTNWNGGVVFDEVQADLEAEGYEVLPFLLPACAINAPHRRDRIWFIAHTIRSRTGSGAFRCNQSRQLLSQGKREKDQLVNQSFGESGPSSNAAGQRCREEGANIGRSEKWTSGNGSEPAFADAQYLPREQTGGNSGMGREQKSFSKRSWNEFPSESPVCGRDDGIPHRMDRLKSLGNAIVPEVALEIFKAIDAYENL